MIGWRAAVRTALITGSMASVLSAVALASCGKRQHGSAAGPVNGPSQWVWGQHAAYRRKLTWRHTALGYLIHHLVSIGWATIHEKHIASRVEGKPFKARLLAAGCTAALAYFGDYGVARGRLRPGFEKQLSHRSLVWVYAAFALGLVLRGRVGPIVASDTAVSYRRLAVKNEIISTLNDLIETSKDGEQGFALAAKDVKDPELTSVFSEGAQSCRVAVTELQNEVRRLGADPEQSGTVKGAAHRGWVNIKAAVTGRDTKAILEECERGEDYAKARYAEALKQDLPDPIRSLVERQYQGVVANHDRVRDLRNRYRAM